jgi:PAS domain S-box-containing protein
MRATRPGVRLQHGPIPGPDCVSERATPIDPAVAAGWLAAIDRSQFVLELEPDGTILRVNALLCEALGCDEAELVGRRHRDLIVPGARANASAGEPHRTIAYQARDGRQILVRASMIPILGGDSRPARSLVIGIDVSDHSELHAALAERDRGAARPDRAGSDEPGTCPGDLAALFLAGWLDLPCRHEARTPLETARSMRDLLDCFAGASADEGGGDRRALAAIPVADYVGACADAMRPAAVEKGLVLRCEVDPDLPHLLECDPLRLRQVLFHLIGNAVRFTERGWISICAEPAWDDPDTLAISVTDTGIGMEGGGARVAPDGTGAHGADGRAREAGPRLGLAVSAETARQMGGTLTLSSERGRGTRAELRVPLWPAGSARVRLAGRASLLD